MGFDLQTKNRIIKEIAEEIGFDQCGIAKVRLLEKDAKRLESWLLKGYHGEMKYMENHFDLRIDPKKLVPGAKSIITVSFNYFPTTFQREGSPKISKYAYGKDYHLVIRDKLNIFLYRLREKFGKIEGRGFVDSAPVLERAWARESGLGWIGKNGNLINKKTGSYYFLATLITDLEVQEDLHFSTDHCGTCTKCIDACPTSAILPGKEVDGSKCISYFTIELKSADLPDELQEKNENWVFGCDICQDVCPWNRFSKPHDHSELVPLEPMISFSIEDWLSMGKQDFNHLFKYSPLKRTGWEGMLRNLKLFRKEE